MVIHILQMRMGWLREFRQLVNHYLAPSLATGIKYWCDWFYQFFPLTTPFSLPLYPRPLQALKFQLLRFQDACNFKFCCRAVKTGSLYTVFSCKATPKCPVVGWGWGRELPCQFISAGLDGHQPEPSLLLTSWPTLSRSICCNWQ